MAAKRIVVQTDGPRVWIDDIEIPPEAFQTGPEGIPVWIGLDQLGYTTVHLRLGARVTYVDGHLTDKQSLIGEDDDA